MGISGIGSFSSMAPIDAVSMNYSKPQIKNTNELSSDSLNRISSISDDVTKSKVDFTGLVEDAAKETTNPLKRGESVNFADILSSQMAMSMTNRSRVMMNTVEQMGTENDDSTKMLKADAYTPNPYRTNMAMEAYGAAGGAIDFSA